MSDDALFSDAMDYARRYRASLSERPVGAQATAAELRARFSLPLSERGEDARAVLRALAVEGDAGLVATAGPRFFGFVIGGSHPVALAADWLTSTWDQNTGLYVTSPLTAVLEETAGRWLCELFGLPEASGVGFVTGTQLANLVGLACARHALLAQAGWDVEAKGLLGAPALPILVGNEVHITVLRALRFLGLGAETALRVPVDGQGRMQPEALAGTLARLDRPALVCAQAGNVNTGAIDPLSPIADAVERHRGLAPRGWRLRPLRPRRTEPPARWRREWSGLTPGRWTCTNGSTSPMTPGWPSSATRRCCGRPWAAMPPIW